MPSGDIVNGDGDGDGDAKRRVAQGCRKGGQPLREVVDADGHGRQHPCPLEPDEIVFRVLRQGRTAHVHLLDGVHLVRILVTGHQFVDDRYQQRPREERSHSVPACKHLCGLRGQHFIRLAEYLDERDIDHHPGGKAQRHGQKPRVRPSGEECDGRPHTGGQTGEERQTEREQDIAVVNHRGPPVSVSDGLYAADISRYHT